MFVLLGKFDIKHDSLAAELALCSDLLRDSCHFPSELSEAVDHCIDDILELNHNHALNRNHNLLREVASSDGLADTGDIANLCLEEREFLGGREVEIGVVVVRGDAVVVVVGVKLGIRMQDDGLGACMEPVKKANDV